MADETWPGQPLDFEASAAEDPTPTEPPQASPAPMPTPDRWIGQRINLTPSGDPELASYRSSFANELQDPQTRHALYSLTHNEVGTQGEKARQAFLESVFNRATARNMSLAQTISDRSYFPKVSFREANLKPNDIGAYDDTLANVVEGSNITNYATGNASGTVGFAGGPQTARIGGEKFGIEGPDIGWQGKPTGKKVALETYTPEEITPVQTLETRRAKAVHPEDEPWPGVKIEVPAATAESEIQTKQPEQTPTTDKNPLVEGVSRSLKKLGDAFVPLIVGDIRPLVNMVVPNADDLKAIGNLIKPETWQRNVKIGSPEYYEQVTDNAIPLIGVAAGAGLRLRAAGEPMPPEFQAGIDQAFNARTQSPTSEAGLPYMFPRVRSAQGALPPEDFIDVPFVRVDSGTLGQRLNDFLVPKEGARPAQGLLLHPGESVPPPLLGYPLIPHSDGSKTVVNPASLEGATEADVPPPLEMNPDEAFATDIEQPPTPEDLALPRMSASEFDNYLADLQRQDQLSYAQDIAGAGTPVMNFIQDVGGIISKSKAKRSGLYDKAGGALWDDVPKELTSVDMRHLWNGTETPDNMATTLYNEGLIPAPDVGAMWNAWQSELSTLKATKAPKLLKGFESELPPVAQVQHELELLGLTDEERLIANGTHYVVANPLTGEIRELFPTREQGMDYLQNMASPGEALVRRKMGAPDQLVAKRPDDVTSMQDREVAKVQKATGGDYDQYLKLETETDAERAARESAEAKTNEQIQAQRQRQKDIKLETKLGFKARKLRGDTGDLGQMDVFGGGDLFSHINDMDTLSREAGGQLITAKTDKESIAIQAALKKRAAELEQQASTTGVIAEAKKQIGANELRERVKQLQHENDYAEIKKAMDADESPEALALADAAQLTVKGEWESRRQMVVPGKKRGAAGGIKFKGKGEAGGISLQPLEPAAKAIREAIERKRVKDILLAKEGAVENFAVIYPRERMNMVRRDFGTPAEAMKKGTKAYKDLEALAIITDHGGDLAKLRAGRDLVAQSKTAAGRALLPKWDYALLNFNRIKNTPNRFRDEMDRQFALEKHNNVSQAYRADYVSHVFDDDPKGFFGWFTPTPHGPGGTSRWFTKTRAYPTIADAVHDGVIPKSLNAADLGELRLRAGQRLVLRKAYRELMQKLKVNGKPVAVDKPTQGYETMKIHGVDVHVNPEVADFVAMLFEPSAIRRHAVGRGVLTVVGVQKQFQLALDTFHAARLSMYGAGAGKGRTRFGYKRGLGVLELSPDDYAKAIQSGEYTPAEVKYARENRPLMLELLAQGANVAKWSDNIVGDLHRVIPGTRAINSWIFDNLGRGALTQGLLENYKRILKRFPELPREKAARKAVIEMNEQFGNLGRRSLFKHKTFQDVSQMIFLARQWVESQFRSEARAYGQMAAYPYNVAEGLVRGQGLKSFGRLGVTAQSRLSLAIGLLVAGQIINYALNGKSTFENPEGHKLDAAIPIGGKTYYLDTAQIPFEFSHQIIKYMRKGEGVIGTVAHILENKLSKAARGAKIIATGQSYRGGAVTGPITGRNATTQNLIDRGRQLAAEELPMPIASGGVLEPEPRSNWLFRQTRRPDAVPLQAAASLGAKLEPEETPRDKVYKMVRDKGMEQPGEDRPPGKYSQLRQALDNRDVDAVKQEMSLLMREAPTRKDKIEMFKNIRKVLGVRTTDAIERDPYRGAINPQLFTGKVKSEIQFRGKLRPEERSLYNQAQQDHQKTARFFLMLEPQLKRLNIQ